MSTNIEWCDEVWNPTTGCTKGCSYCYARPIAENRLKNNPLTAHQYRNGFTPTCHPDRLDIPLKWKKPRRIFVNSMGDLFDESIPFEFVLAVLAHCCAAPQHKYLILTKNPDRMLAFESWMVTTADYTVELTRPWFWFGVSITCQDDADYNIQTLLKVPTGGHFISVEPMHGPVDLLAVKWWRNRMHRVDVLRGGYWSNFAQRGIDGFVNHSDMPATLKWVIAGPQSGAGKRPYQLEWFYSLLTQCRAAGVPFFLKGIKDGLEGVQVREFPA